jgi:hypothetical protein
MVESFVLEIETKVFLQPSIINKHCNGDNQ